MSIFDRNHPELLPFRRLLEQDAFREARALLDGREDPKACVLRDEIDTRAALHWLEQAESAATHGARDRMNACLAEAARFHGPTNAQLFRETRRRLRQIALELTIAPHWAQLLRAAAHQRAAYFGRHGQPPPVSYRTFANDRLMAALGEDVLDLEVLDDLGPVGPTVAMAYPAELRDRLDELPAAFLRSAVRIAGGRPDLAALDLLELPDAHPLVCLDRARVAYALGLPETAMLALADFVRSHGSHVVLKRLHTGVFMAQLAEANGSPERAADLLASLPLDGIGRRPVLHLARLWKNLGRPRDAREVLIAWLHAHPNDDLARGMLQDLPS